MRTAATVSKVLMWGFMVFYLAMQALAVFALWSNNTAAIEANKPDSVFNLAPLIAATVLMLAAVILFSFLRRWKSLSVIAAFVAAVIMLVVAMELGRTFPVSIGTGDTDVGLSTAKLIWRHVGIAVVPVCMLVAWLCGRSVAKAEAARESARTHYDLSSFGPVFADRDKDRDEINPPRKLKRSLRKKFEKMQEQRGEDAAE